MRPEHLLKPTEYESLFNPRPLCLYVRGRKKPPPKQTMSDNSKSAFDAKVSNYMMYIPVGVQEAEDLRYNDQIRVTLYGPEETTTFTTTICAGSVVSVPARLQRAIGLSPTECDEATAVVENANTTWQGETPMETRSSYRKEVRSL